MGSGTMRNSGVGETTSRRGSFWKRGEETVSGSPRCKFVSAPRDRTELVGPGQLTSPRKSKADKSVEVAIGRASVTSLNARHSERSCRGSETQPLQASRRPGIIGDTIDLNQRNTTAKLVDKLQRNALTPRGEK